MSTAQQTLTKLRQLKLAGMAESYALQLEQPRLQSIAFDERLAMLVDQEFSARDTRRLKRLMRAAGFPEAAALEDLDTRASRGLDPALLATLSSCEWVRRQQNLILLGATGVGKTWLASAFGAQACRLGMGVLYRRCTELYADIATAMADGSLANLKAHLIRPSLLILDDLGYGEMSLPVGHVLLDVVDRRMRSGSLLITSQYPTDQWLGCFPDPTLAEALLDRIVHQAHRLTLKGDSMRKLYARKGMGLER